MGKNDSEGMGKRQSQQDWAVGVEGGEAQDSKMTQFWNGRGQGKWVPPTRQVENIPGDRDESEGSAQYPS